MAITNVQGTVTRVFYSGKGAEVTETFTAAGNQVSKRWTCWFDSEHGLSEGQPVSVSGLHGDQVDEWTDKENLVRHSVKRSLNKVRIQEQSPREPAPPVQSPTADRWAPDAELPF